MSRRHSHIKTRQALRDRLMREHTERKRKEQAMGREKQIEEMANEICAVCHAYKNCVNTTPCTMAYKEAEELYQDKGYRKQSDGEWIPSDIPQEKYVCSVCGGACWYYDYQGDVAKSRYCPNCGAHMNGGANMEKKGYRDSAPKEIICNYCGKKFSPFYEKIGETYIRNTLPTESYMFRNREKYYCSWTCMCRSGEENAKMKGGAE